MAFYTYSTLLTFTRIYTLSLYISSRGKILEKKKKKSERAEDPFRLPVKPICYAAHTHTYLIVIDRNNPSTSAKKIVAGTSG